MRLCTLLCSVRKSCDRSRMRTRALFFSFLGSIFICVTQYSWSEKPSVPTAPISPTAPPAPADTSSSASCVESLDAASSSSRRFVEHEGRATCTACAFALLGTNAAVRAATGTNADLRAAALWSCRPNTSKETLATAARYFASASACLFEACPASATCAELGENVGQNILETWPRLPKPVV